MSSLEGLNNSTTQILCSVVYACARVCTILCRFIFSLYLYYILIFSATNILTGGKNKRIYFS